MAGYAAGFSGLESFSPSSFSRSGLSLSIPSLVRAVFLSLTFSLSPSFIVSFNGAGKAGEETGSEEESKIHRETERETSRSRFFAVREMFDLVEIPLISPMQLSSRATKRAASPKERHERSRSFRQRVLLVLLDRFLTDRC